MTANSYGPGKNAIFQVLHPYTGTVLVSFEFKSYGKYFGIQKSAKGVCEVYSYNYRGRKKITIYWGRLENFEYRAYDKPRRETKSRGKVLVWGRSYPKTWGIDIWK